MPVTCFSATGALSFDPVAPRDQAVGPMAVTVAKSVPDEIIEPGQDANIRLFHRPQTIIAIAAMTVVVVAVAIAGAIS